MPSKRKLESIARTVALETGNAIRTQARPEVKSAVDVLRYFGGVAGEVKGETVPLGEHVLSYTRREPIGVVGGIVPWNAPVVLGTLKIAMSVAAGNTLVLKAAEDAPLGLLRVAQLCNEHLPPGVVNLLTGYGEECGAALARHPLVRKLSFTGSTEVGKLIMHAAADRIVPVSLELGGKSPAIVFPDADDARTVDGVISGMRVTRQGQSCTAGSRLFLHRSIFESFLDQAGGEARDAADRRSARRSDRHGRHHQPQAVRPRLRLHRRRSRPEGSARACSAGCRRPPDRWRRATSCSRRCLPTSATTGASPARRSSVR